LIGDPDGFVSISGSHTNTPGSVLVYTDAGGSWRETATLVPEHGIDGDSFGDAVAISGSTILIGADDSDYLAGGAYVFSRKSGIWSQQGVLVPPAGSSTLQFGNALALDGRVAVIGADASSSGASQSVGGAFVYYDDAKGTWTESGAVSPPQVDPDEYFGDSVGVSGTAMIVGSDGEAYAYGIARRAGTVPAAT
jgi:hypothetical protein